MIQHIFRKAYLFVASMNLRLHFSSKVWSTLDKNKRAKFLIRVDDFPRNDLSFGDFMEFHKIMNNYNCPYLLGVTPFLPKGINKKELDFLRSHKFHNVDLSLHGFTHEKLGDNKYQGEVDCYSLAEVEILTQKSKSFFSENNIEFPDSFIPPFNVIKKDSFAVLSKYFPYIMGGPLSVTTLGFYKFLDRINTSLYIPSYFPFYGYVKDIHQKISCISMQRDVVIVITFHWSWEMKDNYSSLIQFLDSYSDRVVNYNDAKINWRKVTNEK
jgi:hypothetical protein